MRCKMDENRSLTVKDDAVNLPVLKEVRGDSDDFRSLVKEAFPPAISEEVCEIRKGSEEGHSRLGILVTVLFCVAVAWMAYRLWPRPMPPVSTKAMDVKDDTPPVQKEYADLAKEAQRLLDAKKYNECAHLLLKPLDGVFQTMTEDDRSWRGNLKLFVLYCSAVIDGKLGREYSNKCKAFLSKLQQLEPDDFKWHSYWLVLESEELLKNFQRIEGGNNVRLLRVELCLSKIDYVIRRDAELNGGEHREGLDLIKAQLLTTLWLLKGIDRGLPDDKDSPGVSEREEAYALAGRYPNGSDFIALRLFILDKMLSHSGIFNRYYFKGNVYYSNSTLEDERKGLQNRMGGNL